MPVFDMSSSEELASKTVSVTVKVVDDTVTVDKTDLSKALASAKQLRESDYTAASWKAFAAALAPPRRFMPTRTLRRGRRRRNRRVEQGAGRVGEGRRFRFGRWLERFD